MLIDDVLQYYQHKQINIARALKVQPNTVSRWVKQNRIPFLSQCQLELLTNGKLKANRHE